MKYVLIAVGFVAASLIAQAQSPEKTSFQASAPWNARYDIRSDIAMVYGMDSTFEQRVKGYRDAGYDVQFMTGIAWGEYQDYFTGKFDGKTHWREGQITRNNDTIWHGHFVPYVVPVASYLEYFKSIVRRVIDAGVTSIYLEEPEFWARAGYGELFKEEWQKFYGFPWMAQDESPEATYLASKLKYQLYYNALKEVFTYAKGYGRSKGLAVKCYVPTHSLLNYSSWQIVSPEASLASLQDMDGYIAQVWTGTAREPNYFNGVKKERVFETAFLEYGSMLSMTEPTHRKLFFLTDPIEDWPRTWDDYKRNYQATYTAELLYSGIGNYEVMPWPNRIYLGKFKLEGQDKRQPISPAYATQMQVMINALNDMPAVENPKGSSIGWISGSKGVGVLVSNSMMFQRFPTHKGYEDPQLSNFYGMAMPLVKRGIPVETVHMENLGYPETLKNMHVLVMSYANMKPPAAEVHKQLAQWVRNGGVLIYYGRDEDPFQSVREWWNTNGRHWQAPSQDLFAGLGIKDGKAGTYRYGKGQVVIVREDPKELVMNAGGDSSLIRNVGEGYVKGTGRQLELRSNFFFLKRGNYIISAVMDETGKAETSIIKSHVIDLFDPMLPVLESKTVQPGEQAVLFDLDNMKDKKTPAVLCGAARVYEEKRTAASYEFVAKSPSQTQNVMRVLLPEAPKTLTIGGQVVTVDGMTSQSGEGFVTAGDWDAASHTLLVRFPNQSEGVSVQIKW